VVVVDHGRAIAEGTPAERKRSVGGARLHVTLSAEASHESVVSALAPYVAGTPLFSDGHVSAPVNGDKGLATLVVRALDSAGILVDDVEVRQPSLDDVFFALTGQPAAEEVAAWVLFTVLFVYVFGSGMSLPGGASDTDFVLAGLLTMNLVTSSMGTGIGLATDSANGIVERFRTLPMWRASALVGRTISDLLSAAVCSAVVAAVGLAVGWRPGHNVWSVLGGLGVALLFSYALSWATACFGLLAKEPEAAMSVGFVVIFPLAFVSNALVPTLHMPSWLRVIADWNPVSSVTATVQDLFGSPNPMPANASWPVEHPLAAALIWSVGLVAIAARAARRLPLSSSAGVRPTEVGHCAPARALTDIGGPWSYQLQEGRGESCCRLGVMASCLGRRRRHFVFVACRCPAARHLAAGTGHARRQRGVL
jgi:ABC-2 type transport system permease protein